MAVKAKPKTPPPAKPAEKPKAAPPPKQAESPAAAASLPVVVDPNANLPISAEELARYSGAGMETIGKDDLAIPFLSIIQALSPQLVKNKPEYNEDAEAGMILNTATGELWSGEDGVMIVPIAYARQFIEWKPDRGGFVAQYKAGEQPTDVSRNDKGQDVRANGNQLADTREYFALVIDEDDEGKQRVQQCVVAMSSTQIKKSKKWNGLLQAMKIANSDAQAPIFANVWRFTTEQESNDKGDWYGWKYELVGPTPRGLFQRCLDFMTAVNQGTVKAAEPVAPEHGEGDGHAPF